MGPLLPRLIRIAVGSLVLLALISLPMLGASRIQENALTPTIAWAGGSPDETLKPPDTPPPPPSSGAGTITAVSSDSETLRTSTRLTLEQRWMIFFNVLRTYVARL